MSQFDFSTFFTMLFWFFNFFFMALFLYMLYGAMPLHLLISSTNWFKIKYIKKMDLLKAFLRFRFLLNISLMLPFTQLPMKKWKI